VINIESIIIGAMMELDIKNNAQKASKYIHSRVPIIIRNIPNIFFIYLN